MSYNFTDFFNGEIVEVRTPFIVPSQTNQGQAEVTDQFEIFHVKIGSEQLPGGRQHRSITPGKTSYVFHDTTNSKTEITGVVQSSLVGSVTRASKSVLAFLQS